MKKFIFITFVLLFSVKFSAAQNGYFEEVTLAIDTNLYKLSENTIQYREKKPLYFEYGSRNAICEVRFYPKKNTDIKNLAFVHSGGYNVLDSLILIEDSYYRGRVQFIDLYNNRQLSLLVNVVSQKDSAKHSSVLELPLFAYTQTWVKFFPSTDLLYVGEEKVFDLETNNIDNIKITGDWRSSDGIDYRVALRDGRLFLHVSPKELGTKNLVVQMETIAPFLDSSKQIDYKIVLPTVQMNVRSSRLVFLNMDKNEVTYDDESRSKGVMITIDNNRRLQINRTYRVEDQEAPGGTLIGELFTLKGLANDKVLCKLTVFNLHRKTEGYLYIKDRDVPMFIANLDITPKMQINRMFVLHEGEDWKRSSRVYPGELVDVSIEGQALHKARFSWEDAVDLTSDTINQTENRRFFRLRIPMDVNKRSIALLNNGQPTGTMLVVDEYQRPKPFDFVTLNYGDDSHIKVNKIANTIISRNTVSNLTFSFDRSNIDSETKLYGKQYLDIDVRILGKKGEIIEMKNIRNQLICPDETSPRGAYYNDKSCLSEDININNYLSNKTNSLNNFGRVQVDIKQVADKYSEPIFEKRIDVVYQPKVVFDIDLSFPAGLLIQNLGKTQSEKDADAKYNLELGNYNEAYKVFQDKINDGTYEEGTAFPAPPSKPKKSSFTDNLGGVSIALIAQFSFPDGEKAGKLKPFRTGAGFLFINTFNFRDDAKRDLAAVILASVYPLSSRRMFNVPIHVGFGYKFQDKIPFLMISPGISITF